MPILKGDDPPGWRASFYYEYPQPHHVPPHHGVVDDRHELVHCTGPEVDDWGLFDLEADPRELRNAIGDPANAPVVADLRAELARLRRELEVPDRPPPGSSGPAARAPSKKRSTVPVA